MKNIVLLKLLTWLKILKFSVDVEFLSPIIDEPRRRKPDISLANESLSWYPKYSIIEGLSKTIENFKTTLKKWIYW